MMLLQQQAHVSPSPSSSNLMASSNFAGMLLPHKGVSYGACMSSKVDGLVCILDFGTSNHMSFVKNFLFNVQTLLVPYLMSLPNGYKVKVTNIGSLALFPNLILHNVLYIPSFQCNIISVHKLLCLRFHICEKMFASANLAS